jgi:hypothetical protein
MALPDPDAQFTRDQLADELTKAGYPTTKTTLATKASRGGGPPFRKWGRRPIHRWGDALAWAQSRLGPVVRSSSELDVASRRAATNRGEDGCAPAQLQPAPIARSAHAR